VVDKGKTYYSKSGAIRFIKVKQGDTLKLLAKKYKTTPDTILRSNGLHSATEVIPGMSLIIPGEGKQNVFATSLENDNEESGRNEQIVTSSLEPLSVDEKKEGGSSKQVTGYLVAKSKIVSGDNEVITKKDVTTEAPKTQDKNEKQVSGFEEEDLDLTKGTEKEPVEKSVKVSTSTAFKVSSPLDSDQFDWPVDGKVMSRYGKVGNRFNDGINIATSIGTPVVAASEGKVIYIGENIEGYGNLVIVKHDNDYMTAYAHLKDVLVERGSKVKRGESIGTVGQSGNISQPQLHFSIRKGKKTIDPELPVG
jgi:murein DD-endopeptidase MepM/ murein hydrolase activator NlpD